MTKFIIKLNTGTAARFGPRREGIVELVCDWCALLTQGGIGVNIDVPEKTRAINGWHQSIWHSKSDQTFSYVPYPAGGFDWWWNDGGFGCCFNWAHRLEATAVFSGTMYSVLSTWLHVRWWPVPKNGILLVLVYPSGRIESLKISIFTVFTQMYITSIYIYIRSILLMSLVNYTMVLYSLLCVWSDLRIPRLWHTSLIGIPLSSPKIMHPRNLAWNPIIWWVGLMVLPFQGWIFRYLPTESHHGNRRQLSSRAAGGIFLGR